MIRKLSAIVIGAYVALMLAATLASPALAANGKTQLHGTAKRPGRSPRPRAV
jgi:hypothetical protein